MQIKRYRGKFLTPTGYKKLMDAVKNWEHNHEKEYNRKPDKQELAGHLGFNTSTLSRLYDGNKGNDKTTLTKVFATFGLELETDDYVNAPNDTSPPAPKYMVLKWEQFIIDEQSSIDVDPPSIRFRIDELNEEQQKAFDEFIVKLTGNSSQKIFKNVGIWKSPPEIFGERDRSRAYRDDEEDYAQLIELGENQAVIFIMQIISEEEAKFLVLPSKEEQYLPIGLQILLLDEQENIVDEIEADNERPSLGMDVSGESGDKFSISIKLGNVTFTESFVF